MDGHKRERVGIPDKRKSMKQENHGWLHTNHDIRRYNWQGELGLYNIKGLICHAQEF